MKLTLEALSEELTQKIMTCEFANRGIDRTTIMTYENGNLFSDAIVLEDDSGMRAIVGFVCKSNETFNSNIISTDSIIQIVNLPKQLQEEVNNSKFFGKFTLAINYSNKNMPFCPEIRTFDSVFQVKDFFKIHGISTDIADKIVNSNVRNMSFDDGDVKLTLQKNLFFGNVNDKWDNQLEIKDLDTMYSGLRYNGVDYECQKVLCGRNQVQGQILAFITADGEILDINDPLLDGVYLIEGDESKKFKAENLIISSEVEAPYSDEKFFDMIDGENANADIAEQHAFGRYIVVSNFRNNDDFSIENMSNPVINSFSTHNDVIQFFSDGYFPEPDDEEDKKNNENFLKSIPETVGYGYDAKFAPHDNCGKMDAIEYKNELFTFLFDESSIFNLDSKSKAELDDLNKGRKKRNR